MCMLVVSKVVGVLIVLVFKPDMVDMQMTGACCIDQRDKLISSSKTTTADVYLTYIFELLPR